MKQLHTSTVMKRRNLWSCKSKKLALAVTAAAIVSMGGHLYAADATGIQTGSQDISTPVTKTVSPTITTSGVSLTTIDGQVLPLPKGMTVTTVSYDAADKKTLQNMQTTVPPLPGDVPVKLKKLLDELAKVQSKTQYHQLRGEDKAGLHTAFVVEDLTDGNIMPLMDMAKEVVDDSMTDAQKGIATLTTTLEKERESAVLPSSVAGASTKETTHKLTAEDYSRFIQRVKGLDHYVTTLRGDLDALWKLQPAYPQQYSPLGYYLAHKDYLNDKESPKTVDDAYKAYQVLDTGRNALVYLGEWYLDERDRGTIGEPMKVGERRAAQAGLDLLKNTHWHQYDINFGTPVQTALGKGFLSTQRGALDVDGFLFPLGLLTLERYEKDGITSMSVLTNDSDYEYWQQQMNELWQVKQ